MQTPIEQLLSIMQHLRDPETGCPWDKEQNFQSVAPHTLEETYEVLDAIQQEDYGALTGELGDLLFQIVFYAQMGSEQNLFTFDDVCNAINTKLIRRHPHVFHQQIAKEDEKRTKYKAQRWEQLKADERAEKAQYSVLDDIPDALPALMKAHKIQQRCASVGFDWATPEPVLAKVYEEIEEVKQEASRAEINRTALAEELGDLLFATVNLTRHMGFKAEMILQAANRKFERRFRAIEQRLFMQGSAIQETTLEEMEALWQQIKHDEKQQKA